MAMGKIFSKNWAGKECALVDTKTGVAVDVGEKRVTSRNETVMVTGGKAPHKEASSGRVWCDIIVDEEGNELIKFISTEWFPSVIGCHWEEP
jgi:hypothetical protein